VEVSETGTPTIVQPNDARTFASAMITGAYLVDECHLDGGQPWA
jgi:hypothetical protein